MKKCRNNSFNKFDRYGFVECLEAEEWSEPTVQAEGESAEGEGAGGTGTESVNYVRQAKEGVLVLLQHVLPTAPPNFAHFLLGYNLSDDVRTYSFLYFFFHRVF